MFVLLFFLYAYASVAGLILYTLLMGPTDFHKNGLIGKFYRFLVSVPKRLCTCCCGSDFLRRAEKYFLHSRNPILQLVYLSLLSINVVLYLFTVFKAIPNLYVPAYHRYTGFVALVLTYFSFLKASFSDPGFIKKTNAKQFEKSFPFDEVMYISERKCTTCDIIRPARSKHCPLSGKCVAKFDHYCGWLNNDVGELNYRWFHLFLISNFLLIVYAVYVYVMTLWSVVDEENLWNVSFMTSTGERVNASLSIILQYMLARYIMVVAQLLFIAACGLMIFGFWGYHFYLVCTNTTTNETFKKKDLEQLWDIVTKYVETRKKKSNIDVQALYDELYKEEEEANEMKKEEHHDEEHKKTEEKKKQVRKEWKMKLLEKMCEMAQQNKKLNLSFYNRGIWNNIKEVIFPPALYHKPKFFEK
ncbi:hypothetical protein FDP41_009502 [Naegleria fowleri]|uniref:Palmitoyltransferase n=1 Tax=Naegleria fowleri TaxID=5763 RepID=A0A6A5BDP5_NAEFO|nr:uncharacterized protein FDP41_009502 [Naegleria fowleri]KAF0972194.1 hypothetical protein FDP41_009502 [Naegleria fowleri]